MKAIVVYDPENPIWAAAKRHKRRQEVYKFFEDLADKIDLKEELMKLARRMMLREEFIRMDSAYSNLAARTIYTK